MDAETGRAIVARRLRAQRLTGAGFARPEDVVGWLGAVQAQDYGPAKWSLGARVAGATDAQVERAFAAGAILRTHVLRPTWHFVLPADIRWLLTATAPRIRVRDARRYAQLGLDDDTLRRSAGALDAALRGGNQLTRREAAAVLTAAGIGVEGQRLPYLLMAAELDALICSGPRRGKQHTYMLLEERAPGRARPAAPRGAGGAGAAVLRRSRAGDGQGLRHLGDADPGRGARRDRGGGDRSCGPRTWAVCASGRPRRDRGAGEGAAPRATRWSTSSRATTRSSWATPRPSRCWPGRARPGSRRLRRSSGSSSCWTAASPASGAGARRGIA